MQILILGAGLFVILYGLYRLFMSGDVHKIEAVLKSFFVTIMVICAVYLAATGRAAYAFGIATFLIPFFAQAYLLRRKKNHDKREQKDEAVSSRKDALDVLGLPEDADEEAVLEAYRRLMKKAHPDQGGSAWMARKIQAARDYLIDKK